MWSGVIPAVATKFDENGNLDHAEMERCYAFQMEAGCHGLVACGTLGEGNMLSPRRTARRTPAVQTGHRRKAGIC